MEHSIVLRHKLVPNLQSDKPENKKREPLESVHGQVMQGRFVFTNAPFGLESPGPLQLNH